MDEKTIHKVAPAILEDVVKLQVDIRPVNKAHALLQRWKWLPASRVLEIHPCTFGTLIKISGILSKMEIDILKKDNLLDEFYKVAGAHGDHIARIIAIAIVNREQDPPASLVRFIKRHFRPADMINTFSIIQRQMDVGSFINSMVLMGKMNLIKTSPTDQGSLIASGPLSEALLNISDSHGRK